MRLSLLVLILLSFLSLACHSQGRTRMTGESLVFTATQRSNLLHPRVRPDTLVLRSTYLPSAPGAITYERNKDYTLDPAAGTIARTPNSRIPDFSTNILYGKPDFDHSQYPGYGNLPFTVYADYASDAKPQPLARTVDYSSRLLKARSKLLAGGSFKVIAFGDSITAGGEASTPDLQYPARYADFLRSRFPGATITLENGATGGDNTVNGLARLEEKVLSRSPDLVLVAFGMNDHNIGGVDLPQFKSNLASIVTQIRQRTGADVILLSTFPPNPLWHFGSRRMDQYAKATHDVADELQVAYADVYATWQIVLARKSPESLLANNINHPNDFGHWLYLEALRAVRF